MKARTSFWLLALVAALPALSSRARADAIFLDMNFSDKEVAAATQAAKGNVIVIPQMSEQDRKTAYGFREQIEDAKSKSDFATVDAVTDKLRSFLQTKGVIPKGQNEIDFKGELDKALTQMGNRPLDPLIISGHHGEKQFEGAIGGLSEKDIHGIFAKHPDQAKSLAAVYLWGCYTLDPSQAKFWKKLKESVFPNLNVLAGFPYLSPSQEWPFDSDFLTNMMLKEHQANSIADAEKIITDMHDRQGANAAILSFCGDSYVSMSNTGDIEGQTLSSAIDCDEAAKHKFETDPKDAYPEFKKYFDATEPGFEDVPTKTDSTNPIRRAYSLGRHVLVCYENEDIDPGPPPPNEQSTPEETKQFWSYVNSHAPDETMSRAINNQMLGLIFFKQLKSRFEDVGKPELSAARNVLQKIGDSNLLPNLADPSLTRHQVLTAFNQLESFINTDPKFKTLSAQDQKSLNAVVIPLSSLTQGQFLLPSVDMVEESNSKVLRQGFGFGLTAAAANQ